MKWNPICCLCFILLVLHAQSFSQVICGFDAKHTRRMKTDSSYRKRVSQTEKEIANYIKKNQNRIGARISTTTALALFTIPVVVHVIHTGGAVGSTYNPSDAQIQGAIEYLNQVYNGTYPGTAGVGDIEIQFALAVRDPACNSTNGIDRIDGSGVANYVANGVNAQTTLGADELNIKNLSRWNPSDYYNIWVVNKIDGQDGTSGSFTGGYAWFPGAPFELDGTIMLATQMQSGRKTLPHEVGHAFGLLHPFEGGSETTCPSNAACATDGDKVCDTDPITQPTAFTCRTGINSCTGTPYSSNTEHNYMNYTNCYNLFTSGQKSRMLATAASIYRIGLSNSSALIANNIVDPFVNPISPTCSPVTSADGLNNDYAGILSVQVNNKTYKTFNPFLDSWYLNAPGGYVNAANNCLKLVELMRGGTYNFSANVIDANFHQLRAWIDYNNDGAFSNTEQIHLNSFFGSPQAFSTSGTFTVPNDAKENTVLRIRVIDDLVPGYPSTVAITSGCHSPVYGQVEDYAAFIPPSTALPVTLLDFKGSLKGDKVELRWLTSNEQNLKSFEIEKSIDGFDYYLVGKQKANGYPNATKSYSFQDPDVAVTNYYRLRMNDEDGQSKISPVIAINGKSKEQALKVLNNPFGKHLDLAFEKESGNVQLYLVDLNGIVIRNKAFSSGGRSIRWDLDNLNPGMYVLKAVVDGKTFTEKIIKQ